MLVALYAGLVVWAARVLPERVPAHWSGTGAPDRWGSRTEAIVMLVVLGVVMVGIFGVAIVAIPRARSLTWVNLPNKWYWTRPEHASRTARMLAVDLGVLGCLALVFCCGVPVAIVGATHSPAAALPSWALPGFIAWLVLILGYALWMVVVRWRVPPEARDATRHRT